MIKRTIDISTGPSYLSMTDDQLVIRRDDQETGRIPLEDIGILLVDHPAVTITHGLLARLMEKGAAVVLCGPRHLPVGLLLPLVGNELTGRRVRQQAQAPRPLRKRLWKQVVRRKLTLQAMNLPEDHPVHRQLRQLVRETRSGDVTNTEGRGAAVYFPAIFGRHFRRDPDGDAPNSLLNYGYMVMRAAVARAIVAAGLHPALSLQHHHRHNAFALADDLVELLRPLVDATVLRLVEVGNDFIDRESKRALLSLLTYEVRVGEQKGPLMVQLHRVMMSLVRCYEGTADRLLLPSYPMPPEELLPPME